MSTVDLSATTHLLPAAAKELQRQVESLEPSANLLNSVGFSWMTGAYLSSVIKSGEIDISELRSNGLSQQASVAFASAVAARHARKAAAVAALARPPAPKPVPTKPPEPPASEQLDQMSAMSMLHSLMQEAERPNHRACLTELINAGWSESASRELKTIIDRSKGY
jgi:hypothetical protein